MAVTMLDAVEFNKIPALQFVVPVVAADPTGYEAGFIYNSVEKAVKYHNGTAWVALGAAGAGAPPSGAAGGDLAGTYPNPVIRGEVIVDADINLAANIQQSKIANLITDLSDKAPNSALANYQPLSQKGLPSGYAPLDAGALIPTAHLPPLAINEVFTVASEAAMIALPAQRGDMAIRTDNGLTYVLSTDVPTSAANWKQVTAAGQVVSVNGKTGVVSITLAELGGVPTTRQVLAGSGLTGGGALSGDIYLHVGGDLSTLSITEDVVSVVAAPKWKTPRTLSLTGDVTGSVALDGSADVSLATAVVGGSNLAKHFAGDVPAGTSCVVTHGLNTRDVQVTVYRNTTPWDTVLCDVQRTSTTTVTLKFAAAVTAAQFRCVVSGR